MLILPSAAVRHGLRLVCFEVLRGGRRGRSRLVSNDGPLPGHFFPAGRYRRTNRRVQSGVRRSFSKEVTCASPHISFLPSQSILPFSPSPVSLLTASHFVIIQQVIAARLPSLLAGIASPTPHQGQKSRTSLRNPKDRTLNLTLTQATRTKTSFAPTPLAVAGPAKMAWNSTKKATTATTATARATQIQTPCLHRAFRTPLP